MTNPTATPELIERATTYTVSWDKASDELKDWALEQARRDFEMDQEVVSKNGFTRAELKAAFELIRPATNWKLPIDAFIPVDKFTICNDAALFFCGSPLDVRGVRPGNEIRVKGAGYYAIIGA